MKLVKKYVIFYLCKKLKKRGAIMQIDKDVKRYINRSLKDIKFYMSLNVSEDRHLDAIKFNCKIINYWVNFELKKRGAK